jgi:hypothetical protein
MDYGISHVAEDVQLTSPGQLIGTPRNMAPEQAEGRAATAQSDQYSLGLVGYFMLEGEDAIPARSLHELIAWHVKKTPIDLGPLKESVSINLCRVLERSLAADPARRFDRMEGLLEALEECTEMKQEAPAPLRQFIRETERSIILVCLCGGVVGIIGPSNVSPAFVFLLLLVGAVWMESVNWLRRSGLGWETLKEAVRSERYRRAEERGLIQKQKTGWGYFAAMSVSVVAVGIYMAGAMEPFQTIWPLALLSFATLGELLPSRREWKWMTSAINRWRFYGLGFALIGAFSWFDSPGVDAFPSPSDALSIVIGIVILPATFSRRIRLTLARGLARGMDRAGAWLLTAGQRQVVPTQDRCHCILYLNAFVRAGRGQISRRPT